MPSLGSDWQESYHHSSHVPLRKAQLVDEDIIPEVVPTLIEIAGLIGIYCVAKARALALSSRAIDQMVNFNAVRPKRGDGSSSILFHVKSKHLEHS